MHRWAAHSRLRIGRPILSVRRHSAQTQKINIEPVDPPPPILLSRQPAPRDAHIVLAPEISTLRKNLLALLGSAHPGLQDLAKFYFNDPANLVRSCVILLFAKATNASGSGWETAVRAARAEDACELDQPLTRADVLPYWNANMPDHAESFDDVFALRPPIPYSSSIPAPSVLFSPTPGALLPTQLRLAHIIEMIHVASLLHDQVTLSPSDSSNKLSILGGDFLLGRASAALSRLGSNNVVELIASVISNLSEGRVVASDTWDEYLKNAYLKSGSLVAKGACSAVVLAGGGRPMQDLAYAFGRNFGMAMQLAEYARDGNLRCWDVAYTYSQQAAEMLRFLPETDVRDTLQVFVNTMVDSHRSRTP